MTEPADNFDKAIEELSLHPVFKPLLNSVEFIRTEGNLCPRNGWAVVTSNGRIHANLNRHGSLDEWIYVLAHCLLHLGFGHHKIQDFDLGDPVKLREWNTACDCFVARLLEELGLGSPPETMQYWTQFVARNEVQLYREFCENGLPENLYGTGTAGRRAGDILTETPRLDWQGFGPDWPGLLGQGLADLATRQFEARAASAGLLTKPQQARQWFTRNFPLLSALALVFEVVEDRGLCRRLNIEVAGVDVYGRRIIVNPNLALDEYEWRFVIAHELLHVGLKHYERRQGRDPFLWNVACDFVINGWLVELEIGKVPKIGVLYDRNLKRESAESIYLRLFKNVKFYRGLFSMRGIGLSDILEPNEVRSDQDTDVVGLDDFVRRCMQQGLTYQEAMGRGTLPAGLMAEIRALSQMPPPWDVQLARWFDHHFPPMDLRRSFARPSRRQSSTPSIPRPSWVLPDGWEEGRTCGVILDTSGSMSLDLLAQAFGAIASYCLAREIPAIRLVFCDAEPYDQGYVPAPQFIDKYIQIMGRGGTVLQPAIDLLEKAEDFPDDGPILVITDGYCDSLIIKREHAFLLPEGNSLPFKAQGPVFSMR